MKIGDLVRPIAPPGEPDLMLPPVIELEYWVGVIIDFEVGDPVVYWNEVFNAEVEYREQLEVIHESR